MLRTTVEGNVRPTGRACWPERLRVNRRANSGKIVLRAISKGGRSRRCENDKADFALRHQPDKPRHYRGRRVCLRCHPNGFSISSIACAYCALTGILPAGQLQLSRVPIDRPLAETSSEQDGEMCADENICPVPGSRNNSADCRQPIGSPWSE